MHSSQTVAGLPPAAATPHHEHPMNHLRRVSLRLQPAILPARFPPFQYQSVSYRAARALLTQQLEVHPCGRWPPGLRAGNSSFSRTRSEAPRLSRGRREEPGASSGDFRI